MFHFVMLALGLLVVFRFVVKLPLPKPALYALSVVVVLIALRNPISHQLFGSMFSPEFPRSMMIVINWLFGGMIFIALGQLVLDLIGAVRSLLSRRRVHTPLWARATLGVAALALSAFGVSQAIIIPPARTVEIAVKDLPPELDGFRVLQLTDLHISRLFQAPWVEAMVAKANTQQADLIVITGDLMDGRLAARANDVAPLAKLRAPQGVYVSPGNHEYYFGYPGWMAKYRELGLRPLANSHTVITHKGAQLVLAGVTDRAAGSTGFPAPDVAKAVAGAPQNAPTILLYHQPAQAADGARAGVDLQLSGHTHGGMIKGLDALVARFNNGYVSGLYDVDGMKLYVNNGTALWLGFALRLGVPSEMTTFVLRPEAAGPPAAAAQAAGVSAAAR